MDLARESADMQGTPDGADRLLQLMLEIRELLRERTPPALPRLLPKAQAAELLACGLTKLNAQIRRGEILTVQWGGQHMVPVSEIERICTPRQRAELNQKLAAPGQLVRRRMRVKDESEAVLAALKKR